MECRIEGITFRECTTLQSERKWAKGKSCGGYQLLPLPSANNAVISIERMQTHLAVDCYQEQVDVLSRNVTNSSAHISHQRGNVPEIHAGNERFARRGLGFSEAQSPACARGTPQPRVDLTHALQSLSLVPSRADDEIELKIKRDLIWILWVISREFRSCRLGSTAGASRHPRLWETERHVDPKQYWNNWKNDMSLFSATNQERPYEQLLHNWTEPRRGWESSFSLN